MKRPLKWNHSLQFSLRLKNTKTSGLSHDLKNLFPFYRRILLTTSCPQKWATVKNNLNKDCSPETIRKMVLTKASLSTEARKKMIEAQNQELAEIEKILHTTPGIRTLPQPSTVSQFPKSNSEYDKIWNLEFAFLILSFFLFLLYKWSLKWSSPTLNLILRFLFVSALSLSFGIGAFWWNYLLFVKTAGPSDGAANIIGFAPALLTLLTVSSFISIGLHLILSPSKKIQFLQNSATNFISFIIGSFSGLGAAYISVQQITNQVHTHTTKFYVALMTTLSAPMIFLLVSFFTFFALAKIFYEVRIKN